MGREMCRWHSYSFIGQREDLFTINLCRAWDLRLQINLCIFEVTSRWCFIQSVQNRIWFCGERAVYLSGVAVESLSGLMIDSIVTAIVRPPRARYTLEDLGTPKIRHKGVEYQREDFNVCLSLFLSSLTLSLSLSLSLSHTHTHINISLLCRSRIIET